MMIRIKKLSNKEYSVRDIKLLKKLLRNTEQYEIDYEEILYNFPGKSMNDVKSICDTLFSRRKKRTLYSFNHKNHSETVNLN